MKQMDRDMMVERYLSRRMGHGEEIEFLRRLGTDPELLTILEAERKIRSTLSMDRDALPRVSVESRFNVLTMLGSLPPVESVAGAGATGGGNGISLLAGGVAKGIIIAVAGIGIVVGGIFVSRDGAHKAPEDRPMVQQASRPRPSSLPLPAPGPEQGQQQEPAPQREQAAELVREMASTKRLSTPAVAKPEAGRADKPQAVHNEAPAQTPAAPRADSTAPIAPHHNAVPRDTVHVRVTIDMNKLRQHP
ncbi:MAG: hypothetical protein ABIR47_17035 [Candidatus Kapaibacterium sp.]